MQLSIKPNRFSALYGAAPRPRPRGCPGARCPGTRPRPFKAAPRTTVSGQVLRVRIAGGLTATHKLGGRSACSGRFVHWRFDANRVLLEPAAFIKSDYNLAIRKANLN
jgi:hypothetical protein